MTRGERRVVERLLEVTVGGDELPPVAETDALTAFDEWLRSAPRANRAALRGLLRGVGAKLRRLPAGEHARWLEAGTGRLGGGAQVLTRIAVHCYYGDERVMRALGYDAAEVARRGLALRRLEGRV